MPAKLLSLKNYINLNFINNKLHTLKLDVMKRINGRIEEVKVPIIDLNDCGPVKIFPFKKKKLSPPHLLFDFAYFLSKDGFSFILLKKILIFYS